MCTAFYYQDLRYLCYYSILIALFDYLSITYAVTLFLQFLSLNEYRTKIAKKTRSSTNNHSALPSFTHPQADAQRYSKFSYLQARRKSSIKASMIAPTGTPCSFACVLIHSLASALTRQHTGTLFSQNPLRPAPSRLPPQVFFSCFISFNY